MPHFGQGFTDSEVTLVVEGEPRLVEISVSPMADHEQRLMVVELRKIDQQKKISQELQQHAQQQAAMSRCAAWPSRDQEPLGGLAVRPSCCKGAARPGLREYTGIIIEQADRLRALVDRLLGPSVPASTSAQRPLRAGAGAPGQDLELPPQIRIERDYDPSIPEFEMESISCNRRLNIVRNAAEALGDQAGLHPHQDPHRFPDHHPRPTLSSRGRDQDHRQRPGIPDAIRDTLYPMITGKEGEPASALHRPEPDRSAQGAHRLHQLARSHRIHHLPTTSQVREPHDSKVWIVDDDSSIRWGPERTLAAKAWNAKVLPTAKPPLSSLEMRSPDVILRTSACRASTV